MIPRLFSKLSLISVVACFTMLIAGCDQPPPQETIIDAQTDALETAREVEGVLMDRAGDLQRKLEDENDDKPPH